MKRTTTLLRRLRHLSYQLVLLPILLWLPASTAVAQDPGWQVDPAAFESSMGLVATVILDAAPLTHPGSILAAFDAGDQIRGVARATVVGGSTLFYLTLYADAEGETLSFQVYDGENPTPISLNETIDFATDEVLGTVSSVFLLTSGTAGANRPPWEDDLDPAAFESSMSLVSVLLLVKEIQVNNNPRPPFNGSVDPVHPQGLVGAFVGGELRGVARPASVFGTEMFFMTIYGNTDGEMVTFEVYDAAADTMGTLEETVMFHPDAVMGSLGNPFAWTTPFNGVNRPGWLNNIDPAEFGESMSVVAVIFRDGVRLNNPNDLLRANIGGQLRGAAAPILVGGTQVFFLTIYRKDTDLTTQTVRFRIYDAATDEIISSSLDAEIDFVPDGVLGTLGTPYVVTIGGGAGVNRPTWEADLNPPDFSASMGVVGAVFDAGARGAHTEDLVGAFEVVDPDTLLRGVGTPVYVDGQQLFFLTTYGETSGSTLLFRYYDAADDAVKAIAETLTFQVDGTKGTPLQPTVWNVGASDFFGVSVTLMLEGPFIGGSNPPMMNTDMTGVIPLTQPYSDAFYDGTPMDYDGTESIPSVPAEMVDWVLLEARTGTAAGTIVARRAALLMADGTIVDTDATSAVSLPGLPAGLYYLVARHRNHLAVMTAAEVSLGAGVATYDFSSGQAQAFGSNAMKALTGGFFGLYAGDGNGSGGDTAADQAIWLNQNGLNGYFPGDYDLSGGNTASDQAKWLPNNGINSQVPEN